MRRTASEVLHDLEMRVARLERQGSKNEAIKGSFSFFIEVDKTVGWSGYPIAEAVKEVTDVFRLRGVKVQGGVNFALCYVDVSNLDELARLTNSVYRNTDGGSINFEMSGGFIVKRFALELQEPHRRRYDFKGRKGNNLEEFVESKGYVVDGRL